MAASAYPGSNNGNLHSCPNSSAVNSDQRDPNVQSGSQFPGPSSHPQNHVPSRPVFYVPAPPPPPFLHYQWPLPFSYNPFTGFPGIGYGMVMPPFAPPPYVESPAYILPQPHIQPIDYRRLLHPQVHGPSAPYQNPNHTRRVRLSHTVPVRGTVNSAVQTEPTQRRVDGFTDGIPTTTSDSGQGTASNSPSSSSACSQKQGFAQVENYIGSNAKDLHACHEDSVGKENVPPFGKVHCNMWSAGSPDSMLPVCSSSQQEDKVVKEKPVSFPDIVMRWERGMPQEIMQKLAGDQNKQLLSYENEVEHETSVCQTPTEPNNGPVVADDEENVFSLETLSESGREKETVGLVGSFKQCFTFRDELLPSPNKSCMFPDEEQEKDETNPPEDLTERISSKMILNSCQMKRKLNESVWSVESLCPFIPSKELLLLQKSNFELTEEAKDGSLLTPKDNLIVKCSKERGESRRLSSSDSVQILDSWLVFSSPAEKPLSPSKWPDVDSEIVASEVRGQKQGYIIVPVDKNPQVSQKCDKKLLTLTEEESDENRSSEPEANQSPNQESLTENEQKKSTCSSGEHLPLKSAVVGKVSSSGPLLLQNGLEGEGGASGNEVSQLRNEQLCVPMSDQRMAKVSPSKQHLVDCGIQCNSIQPCCEEQCRRLLFTYSANDEGGVSMNGNVQKNQKVQRSRYPKSKVCSAQKKKVIDSHPHPERKILCLHSLKCFQRRTNMATTAALQ